ncbi:hypothetical protein Rhopal_001304-T1 [Rhodotorula paludigena]|uniref:Nascent polypeptide-associated complex subunit alpha-like UBA domain-containing protein n=1 Tax=Rhodotorula paludigena TaxID=86838 RepID=A0AAV5GGE6_9BASI|nr:hypothetical protein Rhopal_001304-T1 [Rhodotorula paludigena]
MLKAKAKAAATAAAQKRKEYWADSGASRLAPGGSIQRIGYDLASYEEAVRVVILGMEPPEDSLLRDKVGLVADTGKARGTAEEEDGDEKQQEGQPAGGYKTNKEDLAVVIDQLDVPSALASKTLRAHKGDLAATLAELSAPRLPATSAAA